MRCAPPCLYFNIQGQQPKAGKNNLYIWWPHLNKQIEQPFSFSVFFSPSVCQGEWAPSESPFINNVPNQFFFKSRAGKKCTKLGLSPGILHWQLAGLILLSSVYIGTAPTSPSLEDPSPCGKKMKHCFWPDTDFAFVADKFKKRLIKIDDVYQCQDKCQNMEDCTYFGYRWYSPAKTRCLLMTEKGINCRKPSRKALFKSSTGPKFCDNIGMCLVRDLHGGNEWLPNFGFNCRTFYFML